VLLRSVRTVAVVATAVALLAGTAGCSAGHDPGRDGGRSSGSTIATPGALHGTVTVFAAASLQRTFTTIGHDFERAHPGTTVRFSFAGSSDLVTQIESGAPADVFAAADQASMAELPADLRTGRPRAFATNVLEIAVAPGNPLGIRTLDDLTADDVQLVTCAAPVPCGAATARVERAAGVTLRPVSEEQSVTDVLGKVESGQADAGLVYVTDVRGAGRKVTGVPIAAADRAVNTYPIGVLRDAADPALARAFSAYVRSSDGQRVLAAAGFGKP
jgi:molybdate transport system substrate-binding protein